MKFKQKFKLKKIVAMVTAISLCIVPIPPQAVLADETVSVNYVNTHESAIQGLSPQQQLIVKEAKKQILEIAEGKRSDAILRINVKDALGMDVTDTKYNATLSELGLSKQDFDENGIAKTYNPSVEWQRWAENKRYFDYYNSGGWKKINHAIWEECSFELFWHDKVTQGISAWPVSIVLKEDGTVGPNEDSFVPLIMGIRKDYRAATTRNNIYDSYYTGIGQSTNVNTQETAEETAKTVPNAMAVVEKYKNLSDMEKLTAYRDYILDAVTYDTTSASLIGNSKQEASDAFFIGNVFDDDPNTNVVCEGYAKAFKFLCDLSTFNDPTIDVKLVTGKMTSKVIASVSGDHMWNVVTLDGKNYIVDLTNCDGEKSSYDKLFMVAAKYYYGDYQVETKSGTYTYSYKESDGTNYNDSYLAKDLEITSSVAKKENSWTVPLSIKDILEGDKVAPQAEASHGKVSFVYATTEDGEYTATVPTAIGTYWVKAIVAEDEEYKGLESDPVSFKINERIQQTNSWNSELTASDVVYGNKLVVSAKAAYGDVNFLYATEENGTFTEEVPENVGTYYVKATVKETADYTALESEVKSFNITKATNSWKTELNVKDVTEGLKPSPQAIAAFGKVVFNYSKDANGEFTETVPTKTGTYYVKATVADTLNYSGLESTAVSFKITAKAVDPQTQVPYVNTHDSSTVNLNDQQMKIFNEARRQIREIAAGERSYAILEINIADALGLDVNDAKYNATLSALGLSKSDFDANGKASIDANIAWQRWAENKGYFDYYTKGGSSKLNKALWADCAYDLYWHDRTVKGVGWWPITVYLKDDGTVGMTSESYIPGAFAVTADYRADENTKDEYRQYYIDHPNYGTAPNWDVDTTKAKSTAKTTLTNAKKVVEAAKNLSDYEKLEYYADYIIKAVSYDSEAAKHIGDSSYELGNAWQVPYVFDNNSSTNIVCEGYAKAFKFLCDMTTFEDASIDVRLVTGPCNMNGQQEDHMWNVVTYGEDKNYIVDLTNSDEGSVGAVGTLFMMPASYSSWAKTYNMNGIYYPSAGEEGQSASRQSWSASYKYDDDTVATFRNKDLTISTTLPNSYADAKEAAKDIAKQMKARKNRIVVQFTGSSSGLTGDTFTALRDLAYTHTGEAGLGDNLKRQVESCVPATSGSSNVYIYNMEYFNNASLERQLETKSKELLDELKLEGKSDYQKAKAIYNWLCRNVDYDENRSHTNLVRYSAANAIVNKGAVCEGYANAFYYLASMAGLENRIVVGADHAWNIVKLGEYYYNVDATWDASYYDPDVYPSRGWRFFMKNEATYLKENYPTTQWGTVNGEHHTRLSYDTGDDEFRAAHPMSPTNYGETESGILFKENNGTITITGYSGEATKLVIPDQIAGEPVGTINAKALSDEKLTDITFTSDVATIEENAFNANVILHLNDNCANLLDYANKHNIKVEGIEVPQEENSWTTELTCTDIEVGETPSPKAEAKFGEVTYKYATDKDGDYTDTIPLAIGTYFVKAYVSETQTYTGLISEAVEFSIKKSQNAWVKELSVNDVTYGETPSPSAEAKFGEVRYEYRLGFDGTWSDKVPTEGSSRVYYVRAIVDATDEYDGLVSKEVAFYIDPAKNEWVTALTIADITVGETLEPNAEAKFGTVKFEYSKNSYGPWSEDVPTEAGQYYVRASVEGTDNYSQLSTYVRFTINEKEKANNSWIEELNVSDIDYGTVLNPTAKATEGEVTFIYATSADGEFTKDVPVNAGTYFVKAIVEETDNYKSLESDPVKFVINKINNSLTKELQVADVKAGETPIPFAEAAFGKVTFKYATSADGEFTEAIPTTSGTYFVKAYVDESENYNAFESEAVSFEIKKAEAPVVNNFKDVDSRSPYYNSINWAVEKGITTGTSDTTFSPSINCTRGQVVTFLWRAAGSPEPTTTVNPFKDVDPNSAFYKAILWAVENKITTGTSSTTFNPSSICTRGATVTFIHRYYNGQTN
ncbi:hypothetical protein P261_02027 [Lachnospiraceae bacterium TWA4]|nr:hypothetical protein P261_02027 [Lachnospiraceae bacterium TWA4]